MSEKQQPWFGYLEAGAKSSPVVRDERLNTGNPDTVYIFNLARGEIIEYRRSIVEAKLREFKPAEAEVLPQLKAAFGEARKSFRPRVGRPLTIPERGPSAKTKAAVEEPYGDEAVAEVEVLDDAEDEEWEEEDE